MTRRDITITCKDCGRNFIFRGEEQDFYAEKGYDEPIRCRHCRTARKTGGAPSNDNAVREGAPASRFPQRELFPATCASCGNQAKVPFKPRGDKPVYCSDCFSKQR